MTTKQLSIVVKMIDQASPAARAINRAIADIGNVGVKTGNVFSRAISSIGSSFAGLGPIIAGVVAGAGVYKLASSFDDAARALDDINDAAARTGLSIKNLSELRYIAQLSGQDFGQMADGVSTLNKNLSQYISTGGGKAADAFRELDVQLRDVATGGARDVNELLPDLFDAINNVSNAADQAAITKKIFGDDRFLQFIKEGSAGLRNMAEQARRLGVVFTDEQVAAASKYRDAVDRVSQAWLGLRAKVVAEIGPQLADVINTIAGGIAAVPEVVRNATQVVSEMIRGTLSPERAQLIVNLMTGIRNSFYTFIKDTMIVTTQIIVEGIYAAKDVIGPLLLATITELVREPILASASNVISIIGSVFELGQLKLDKWRADNKNAGYKMLDDYRAEASAIAQQIADVQSNVDSNPYLDGQERFREETRLSELKARAVAVDSLANDLRESLKKFSPFESVLERFSYQFKAAQEIAREFTTGLDAIKVEEVAAGKKALAQNFTDSFALMGERIGQVNVSLGDSFKDFRESVRQTYSDLDQLLGITAAYAKVDITQFSNQAKNAAQDKGDEVKSTWSQLVNGVETAFEEISDRAKDFKGFARDLTTSTTQTFASGFSKAFLDVATGVDRLGHAFRQFFSTLFRQIAETITQFLVLRAITGIVGSFAGAGSVKPANSSLNALTGSSAAAGQSGFDFARGLSAFASGGPVGGAGFGDRRLIRADPREYVVSPQGTAANSRSVLDYANRGGRVVPAGSGPSLHVNTTVQISGGSAPSQSTLKSFEDAVLRAVANALNTKPAFKAAMVGGLQ